MEQARTQAQIVEDIRFYQVEITQRSPLLRTVAGLTYGTATLRSDFIAAAVRCEYNAATAATCWAAGRKVMAQLESEH